MTIKVLTFLIAFRYAERLQPRTTYYSMSLKLDVESKRARYFAAQNICIDWSDVLDATTFSCLQNCALSTGTPIDFYFMPLLSVAASQMNDAVMIANKTTNWREPSILWTIVSALAGKYSLYIENNSRVRVNKCLTCQHIF